LHVPAIDWHGVCHRREWEGSMLATILVHVPLAIFPLLQLPPASRDCQLDVLTPMAIEERSLAEFKTNIDAYVTLHRRLARALPPADVFDDEGSLVAEELHAALVAARPQARPGAFFTPGIAELFRQRLDAVLPWTLMTKALPKLPPELTYEFWGRDLALVDIAADLVLDVLPDALPAEAGSDVIYR
jgi:hypothetical protein